MARVAAALGALALTAAAPAPTLEQQIIAELNRIRADPPAYAERLRVYRGWFRGKIVRFPAKPEGLLTKEGVAAVDEAIAYLRGQSPVPPLTPSALLARAARSHAAEQARTGATGHRSADGANAGARVARLGGGRYVAETITYGPPGAVEVVRQLVVDDDVPGRGHRRIVFSRDFHFAGAACGPHKSYGTMCVVDYGATANGH